MILVDIILIIAFIILLAEVNEKVTRYMRNRKY